MTTEVIGQSAKRVPEIVPIVLTVAEGHRRAGHLTKNEFDSRISRLKREELQPRGLDLLVRELADGRTRFIIKAVATGRVCDLVDFPVSMAAA